MTETKTKPAAAKKPAAKKTEPTIDVDRIAALEQSLGASLGIDVNQFNPREVQAAHDLAVAEAREQAAALIEQAEQATVELTPAQRLERLERAARSAGVTV